MHRHTAIIIGYDGQRFSGMAVGSFEKNAPTVNEMILKVFFKNNLILEEQIYTRHSVGLYSAVTTNKKVSSSYNVVQLILRDDIVGNAKIFETLKTELAPTGIYLYRILNVAKSFVASRSVKKTTYEYYLPVGTLNLTNLKAVVDEESQSFVDEMIDARVDQARLARFKKILSEFNKQGISLHNFGGSVKSKRVCSGSSNERPSQLFGSTTDVVGKSSRHSVNKIDSIQVTGIEEINEIYYLKIVAEGTYFYRSQMQKIVGFIALSMITSENDDFIISNLTRILTQGIKWRVPTIAPHFLIEKDVEFYEDKFKDENGKYVKPTVNENERKTLFRSLVEGRMCLPGKVHYFHDFFAYCYEHKDDIYFNFFSE